MTHIRHPPSPAELSHAWGSPAGLATVATAGATWFPAAHHLLINQWLVDLHTGRRRFIMIFAPPRHGKSTLVSQWLPMWWLGLHPDHEVALACHTSELAEIGGGWARDYMLEHGSRYFDLELVHGGKAPRNGWKIRGRRGQMHAVGTSGTLTGKGANLLIIDDPIKDAAEAESTTTRKSLWRWWTKTARDRLNPKGCVVLMMTRWHWDDLAGRILEQDKRGLWDVLHLPAIAEEGDVLGRELGEALWPSEYPLEELELIKENDVHSFAAKFQQNPGIDEGAIFNRDRFRYFVDGGEHFELIAVAGDGEEYRRRILKDDCLWIQTVDFAHRTARQNDYTVVLTAAITPDKELIVVDVFRRKIEMARQWPEMKRMREAFPRVSYMAAEKHGAGYGPFAAALNDGHVLKELKADREKRVRALPVSVAYENGKVYHDRSAQWLADFEDELLYFPVGKHDDMVDCLSYAWNEILTERVEACMVELGPEDEGAQAGEPAAAPRQQESAFSRGGRGSFWGR